MPPRLQCLTELTRVKLLNALLEEVLGFLVLPDLDNLDFISPDRASHPSPCRNRCRRPKGDRSLPSFTHLIHRPVSMNPRDRA
ncbi:MAG: hypothetical protein MH825_16450 [Cyanobacteria bacterium]|nr:hypothetical protein [Cyanobacteriota bacterium]